VSKPFLLVESLCKIVYMIRMEQQDVHEEGMSFVQRIYAHYNLLQKQFPFIRMIKDHPRVSTSTYNGTEEIIYS